MKRAFIIYGLFDPRDGELRYVGKSETGLERRLREHLMPSYLATPSHKNSWLKGLLAVGLLPVGHVVQSLTSAAELSAAERYWIAFFRAAGVRLTNMTEGGEGFGKRPVSEETRAKMRAAKLGRKFSAEHRAKIAAAGVGRSPSPETRAKLSAAKLGKPPHPNSTAAVVAALTGVRHSPARRKQRSEIMRRYWAARKNTASIGAITKELNHVV